MKHVFGWLSLSFFLAHPNRNKTATGSHAGGEPNAGREVSGGFAREGLRTHERPRQPPTFRRPRGNRCVPCLLLASWLSGGGKCSDRDHDPPGAKDSNRCCCLLVFTRSTGYSTPSLRRSFLCRTDLSPRVKPDCWSVGTVPGWFWFVL